MSHGFPPELDYLYRWCVFCGSDTHEEQPHDRTCPSSTGLFPYTDAEFPHGMMCSKCEYVFVEGDNYTHITITPASEGHGLFGDAAVVECVCVGCAALAAVAD